MTFTDSDHNMKHYKIEINNIRKVFSINDHWVKTIENISCKIEKNEFIVFLGPSGCGKSTLLRMICALETITSGSLLVNGTPPDVPGPDRGIVFQSYTSFPWLTVEQNIEFGLKKTDIPPKKRKEIIKTWIHNMGLEGFEKAYPETLSGGMRQRVAIARTLSVKPDIVLLDEPFGSLDALTRIQMQELLLKIWRDNKSTIVFVTHDLDEAIYMADRIFLLSERPAVVKDVIDVNLPRPREREIIFSEEYIKLKYDLFKKFNTG